VYKPHKLHGHKASDEFVILVNPEMQEKWKHDHSTNLIDVLEKPYEIFIKRHGVKGEPERATASEIENTFNTKDPVEACKIILEHGMPHNWSHSGRTADSGVGHTGPNVVHQ